MSDDIDPFSHLKSQLERQQKERCEMRKVTGFGEALSFTQRIDDAMEPIRTAAAESRSAALVAHSAASAEVACQNLADAITAFEATLEESAEAQLVALYMGTQVKVLPESVRAIGPGILEVRGVVPETGKEVRLLQHVTKVEMLLMTHEPDEEELSQRPIGFRTPHRMNDRSGC